MEGVLPIVLLWKFNAAKMGEITFSEWDAGLRGMQANTLAQLKSAVEHAQAGFATDTASYRAFYRKVFEYLKTDGQKSVQKENALIGLHLIAAHIPVVAKFVGFLGDEACKTKVINKDQWSSLLELSRGLRPDMSNYEDDGAWPCAL
ncbi:DCN1, defective in cullin neddylation 1, domain-containing 4 [Linderina pennispora]|uniref:Defective in cullin neddylation protein n=1 Tax=Linderina pennispora TaxID=61395 RepID=A0A1Y1WDF3_9FUNG|nr:DCN1, defective in cullin neddylation 1, domain-containing 4 [Linderina pennispora]ORX71415.1 DCN1, defective in cullin neddylation 1, domain-containing 4 [Linderina pennispora]